jgi:hypothetical protein
VVADFSQQWRNLSATEEPGSADEYTNGGGADEKSRKQAAVGWDDRIEESGDEDWHAETGQQVIIELLIHLPKFQTQALPWWPQEKIGEGRFFGPAVGGLLGEDLVKDPTDRQEAKQDEEDFGKHRLLFRRCFGGGVKPCEGRMLNFEFRVSSFEFRTERADREIGVPGAIYR